MKTPQERWTLNSPAHVRPIELPPELKTFEEREQRWLWQYLNTCGANLPHIALIPQGERVPMLATAALHYTNQGFLIQDIVFRCDDSLVDTKELAWIKSDSRISVWFFLHLASNGINLPPANTVAISRYYEESVYALDAIGKNLEWKRALINNAHQLWGNYSAPDSLTKWLSPKDHEQLKWAWDYLLKAYRAAAIAKPVTQDEFYSSVLVSIDVLPMHQAERQIFIEKMKKTWSQKVYRAGDSARKPHNMPLKKSTIDMLEKLAALDDIKTYEVVDALIREAYERRNGKEYPKPYEK